MNHFFNLSIFPSPQSMLSPLVAWQKKKAINFDEKNTFVRNASLEKKLFKKSNFDLKFEEIKVLQQLLNQSCLPIPHN